MPAASQPIQREALLQMLTAGTRLLTPSPSAASALRQLYQEYQTGLGASTWQPADVFAWSQWTSSLFTELILSGMEDRILLNRPQELQLWQEIIEADQRTNDLTPVASLAALAADAYALASNWRIVQKLPQGSPLLDVRVFSQWAEEFQRRTDRGRWLSTSQLESVLTEHLAQHHLPLTRRLHLFGFGEFTPAQQTLLDAFEQAGTRCVLLHPAMPSTPSTLRATAVLEDERAELHFALRWLRKIASESPQAQLALVVPSLDAERLRLEPALLELLAPELEDLRADLSSAPWRVEGTAPLLSTSLATTAVDLARWLRAPLALETISGLLLSPYTAWATETDACAQLDVHLLQRLPLLRPELDLNTLLSAFKTEELPGSLHRALRSLQTTAAQLSTLPPRRPWAEWAEFLHDLLRTAGWPGPRALNPTETELCAAIESTLDSLATLDFSGRRPSFAEFCAAFERQLQQTNPPDSSQGRIAILSPHAATGRYFDAVVLLRATDRNLPSLPHLHPLLDRMLQRHELLPGADLAEDMRRAEANFLRLLTASGHVLATRAREDTDGKLRGSALAGPHLPELPPSSLLEDALPPESVALERVDDTETLPPLPEARVAGGARLLKLQAACGFLAFAEMRLGGAEMRTQEIGLDALESGNVLHRALEAFWDVHKSHAALLALNPTQLRNAILEAIDQAFRGSSSIRSSWDEAYLSLKKERMLQLLLDWMDFERKRAPFTVIRNEEKQQAFIGPLALNIRIDRIDMLPDGGIVFVDYKTGFSSSPKDWEGERPDDPQLPLYSLLGDSSELRGIAFAKLRLGKDMKYAGWQSDEGVLPSGEVIDLQRATEEWHTVLTRLAEDFASGHVAINPKSYTVNCKRCAQRLLCRLDLDALGASQTQEDESLDG
ncbi:MAG: PD-(D/E)XK nuclease family protein [Acidobacteriaceae bacterium]|nr:PD-(D/E)XK nuclease family protein [Acidobacteriaceae bacterium]